MPFIIGTDEAGYGPNLGPLVIGATLWQVADDATDDLYATLNDVLARPDEISDGDERIPLADSKALYQRATGIRTLERSALSLLGAVQQPAPRLFGLFDLFDQVAATSRELLERQRTYRWDCVDVPQACNTDDVVRDATRIRDSFQQNAACCHSVAAEVVFPEAFNQGLEDCGNKASLLTATTCRAIAKLLDSLPAGDQARVTVLCDKHGGRGSYAGILQQEMTDSFVRVVYESREESCYSWSDSRGQIEIRFIARGERHMPIALASVVAKYLRELSMQAWNLFWQEHLPALTPTAGYPQDAKRFKRDIRGMQSQLQVDDRLIWREK